jgi:cobyrinic acid a,c-diamide synthase
MCGAPAIAPLAARAGAGCDILVIEGVMGLFDGAASPPLPYSGPAPTGPVDAGPGPPHTAAGPDHAGPVDADPGSQRRAAAAPRTGNATADPGPGRFASTAHVALLLDAPVILVVDASAMSASVAAIVHGFATLVPGVRLAGVILNRVGSDSHERVLVEALEPLAVPVLGTLRRDDELVWRDRHLGLIPVVERPQEIAASLDRLAVAVGTHCALDAVLALARSAPSYDVPALPGPVGRTGRRARIAVAAGPAFSFAYPDNLELLTAAGAELVPFDPLTEPRLPARVDALYAGGGFPEVFAEHLAANRPLLDDVRAAVDRGLVTWAECGGLLWLARSLDGHAMAGVVAADAQMGTQLTLGYRQAVVRQANPVAAAGSTLRGHEFHYSTLHPGGEALELTGRSGIQLGGWASPTLLASYLHVHLAGEATIAGVASRFVATAATTRVSR